MEKSILLSLVNIWLQPFVQDCSMNIHFCSVAVKYTQKSKVFQTVWIKCTAEVVLIKSNLVYLNLQCFHLQRNNNHLYRLALLVLKQLSLLIVEYSKVPNKQAPRLFFFFLKKKKYPTLPAVITTLPPLPIPLSPPLINFLDFQFSLQKNFEQCKRTLMLKNFGIPYRLDRNWNVGGLLLYVCEDIPSKFLKVKFDCNIESICVVLNLRKSKWFIKGSYNPNKSFLSNHFECLNRIIDEYSKLYQNFLFLGNLMPL